MSDVAKTVTQILNRVRLSGDRALTIYTKKFDGWRARSAMLEVKPAELRAARQKVDRTTLAALKTAAQRIRSFHQRQVVRPILYKGGGFKLGLKVTPLDRVGIYVPGGRAPYPSTVLMNAIPAKLAGVREIIMVSPARDGKISPVVLAAAAIAGVDRIFKIGGAQAIAALAYGTKTIPKVDKIVGPGNIFVATAKRLVFGTVDIDMIAGPTEVLIIADAKANPAWIAADLLSQAEHDPDAIPQLITNSAALLTKVRAELKRQLASLVRRKIAATSLKKNGRFKKVAHLDEACRLANQIAPEHLELVVKNPRRYLAKIKNAGAIFIGPHAPVALGDYIAGPNHVLPTGGTARFASPLGVYDFVKRSNVIEATRAGLKKISTAGIRLALTEGLTGHAESIKVRLSLRGP